MGKIVLSFMLLNCVLQTILVIKSAITLNNIIHYLTKMDITLLQVEKIRLAESVLFV